MYIASLLVFSALAAARPMSNLLAGQEPLQDDIATPDVFSGTAQQTALDVDSPTGYVPVYKNRQTTSSGLGMSSIAVSIVGAD